MKKTLLAAFLLTLATVASAQTPKEDFEALRLEAIRRIAFCQTESAKILNKHLPEMKAALIVRNPGARMGGFDGVNTILMGTAIKPDLTSYYERLSPSDKIANPPEFLKISSVGVMVHELAHVGYLKEFGKGSGEQWANDVQFDCVDTNVRADVCIYRYTNSDGSRKTDFVDVKELACTLLKEFKPRYLDTQMIQQGAETMTNMTVSKNPFSRLEMSTINKELENLADMMNAYLDRNQPATVLNRYRLETPLFADQRACRKGDQTACQRASPRQQKIYDLLEACQ
jgi:hypothetical protein